MKESKDKRWKEKLLNFENLYSPEWRRLIAEKERELQRIKEFAVEEIGTKLLSLFSLPYSVAKELLYEESEQKSISDDNILILALVDDTDSLYPDSLKAEIDAKLIRIIGDDHQLSAKALLYSELLRELNNMKFHFLILFGTGLNLYDTGIFSAIEFSELHRYSVEEKLENYLISYVLIIPHDKFSTTNRVEATIIINDTDLKRMTRTEIREKLQEIVDAVAEGLKDKITFEKEFIIRIQLLTEFWRHLKRGDLEVFFLLREGIALKDSGFFTHLKQLLSLGVLELNVNSDDIISSAKDNIRNMREKLFEILSAEICASVFSATAAVLLHYGIEPPPVNSK